MEPHLSFVAMAGSSCGDGSVFLFLVVSPPLGPVIPFPALQLRAPTSGQVCVWSVPIVRCALLVSRRGHLSHPYGGALGAGFLRLLQLLLACGDRLRCST